MNNKQTMSTLDMEGIEAKRAFTTNFIPSFLEIILSGLNALKALRAFKDLSCPVSTEFVFRIRTKTSKRLAETTTKSSIFHPLVIYGLASILEFQNPRAIILIAASIMKRIVKIISIIPKNFEKPEFGSLRGLSTINYQ